MRIGEIALFIANFTLILGSVLVTRKRGRSFYGYAWATAVTAVLSLVQIIAEGYRWQMLPVYAASLVTGGLALRRMRHPSRKAEARTDTLPEKPRAAAKGLRRGIVAFLFLVYAGVSVALPTLLPVFSFVKPQGPYPVGTTTMMLEDPSREEPTTADPADRRKLMIQIWYPAQAGTGTGLKPPTSSTCPKYWTACARRSPFPRSCWASLNTCIPMRCKMRNHPGNRNVTRCCCFPTD